MSTGKWEYKSDFARRHYGRGYAVGYARGAARAVVACLGARGVDIPDGLQEWITQVRDLEQLETWIRRAVTASSVEELFA